jgi:Bacteriocin-protection, YdeI or OmpD-Associated/Domain of unknown function (DUF1905)
MPSGTASFHTTLFQPEGRPVTGIVVPGSIIEQLDHGKRPPVRVSLNGHEYRSTVAVMGGQYLISVSAEIREETGLAAGDQIDVVLTVDTSTREVEVPEDLDAAFDDNPGTREFFSQLSNSLQRYHVKNIEDAKAPETRQRRVDKTIALFLAGKQR